MREPTRMTRAWAVGALALALASGPVRGDGASCLLESPLRDWGRGTHAPARDPRPEPVTTTLSGGNRALQACSGNREFRFAAGIEDITGPSGGKIMMGNEDPEHFASGIYQRNYARAFVLGSPCNGKRVIMAVTDTGMLFNSVWQAVMDRIAADPELAAHYGPANVMLSPTHTHTAPGGYAHYTAYNAMRFGYDDQAFQVIVEGLFAAIREAHRNYEASPRSGPLEMALGELIDTAVSRARLAYALNPEEERRSYLDEQGREIVTNRLMTQLNLRRDDGREVGVINWYSVHATAAHKGHLVSGDNKGYASYFFERMKGTDQDADEDSFVAMFVQSDEGESWPMLYLYREDERPPYPTRPDEDYPEVVISGTKQLARSLELYGEGEPLTGGIDYRQFFVKMDEVTVTDPVVLDSLRHPPEMDAAEKRTCAAALGISFPGGGFGGEDLEREFTVRSGVSCRDPLEAEIAQREVEALLAGKVPNEMFAHAVGCNLKHVPGLNLQCHAEKPILFVFGPPVNASAAVVPFQLFAIGNLGVLALPWEITTMSGRRIRDLLRDIVADAGIDHLVITGLANDYVQYLTTREEYAYQQYEGASNQFGPWTLAAVQQETRRLAMSLRDGAPAPAGPQPPRTEPQLIQLFPPGPTDLPGEKGFGALLTDVDSKYAPGDTAVAVFQTGHPRADLRTGDSFLFVERRVKKDQWETVALDRDPETSFHWEPDTVSAQLTPTFTSRARIVWRIPANAKPGNYRIRHTGAARTAPEGPVTRFEGVSSEFRVAGRREACP